MYYINRHILYYEKHEYFDIEWQGKYDTLLEALAALKPLEETTHSTTWRYTIEESNDRLTKPPKFLYVLLAVDADPGLYLPYYFRKESEAIQWKRTKEEKYQLPHEIIKLYKSPFIHQQKVKRSRKVACTQTV